ncbi:DUF1574 domain-containing protein [Leptospira ilyithenensis]|uniref:DUF1574 domain-containing protein n=1 Tax=Leptospira ilyithenensis TaxID=2484901 RepID=A0A4R9LLA8_9LEPT|nr:DUF1574 domain-containing protein [Leptospira ilyithenensis]TGN08395.1 DUF1574 domain-containing protein [Leptospira ilyithenensis]
MSWKKQPFLFYPLLVCLILFGIDKFFFFPVVVENTHSWKKIERSFYELKEDLYQVLLEENKKDPTKKIGLIFGSSRSGEFDSDQIKKFVPNTNSFNFAAPLGPPSFQYYWLQRMLEEKLPISYVMVEIDPILFTRSSIDYSLNGSYDMGFVMEHLDFYRSKSADPWKTDADGFSVDEVETYFLKKLFALYKYPLDPSAIKANNKEIEVGFIPVAGLGITGKEHKRGYLDKIKLANRIKFGALPNEIKFANADFFLEKDAENIYNQYLKNYQLASTQIYFFKKIVQIMEGKNIPIVFYYPVVAEPLRRRMEESGIWKDFHRETFSIIRTLDSKPNSPYFIIDPVSDNRWTCKDFVDSLHLSGACFSNLLPILFPKDLTGSN